MDFTFLRCAWQTLRRGREQAEYWRWVRAYRRRSLPDVMRAINSEAPRAKLYILRNPAMVQRFIDEFGRQPRKNATAGERITLAPASGSWRSREPAVMTAGYVTTKVRKSRVLPGPEP